jgi:hypothetical protein
MMIGSKISNSIEVVATMICDDIIFSALLFTLLKAGPIIIVSYYVVVVS